MAQLSSHAQPGCLTRRCCAHWSTLRDATVKALMMSVACGDFLIMRSTWMIVIGLGAACARQQPAPANVQTANAVAFRATRAAARGEAAQHLAGHYFVHRDEIEVVVTSGYLEVRTLARTLQDVRAGIATGRTAFSGRWNTPRLSSVRRLRDLGLAPDGSVRDTIRFIIKGTGAYPLADYWLTFQLHGALYSQRAGRVEEVRWMHDSTRFTIPQ